MDKLQIYQPPTPQSQALSSQLQAQLEEGSLVNTPEELVNTSEELVNTSEELLNTPEELLNTSITEEDTKFLFNKLKYIDWSIPDTMKKTIDAWRKTGIKNVKQLFDVMKKISDVLYTQLQDKIDVLSTFTPEEKYNFLFSILLQGMEFYHATLIDHNFCLFLLEDNYKIYTELRKVLTVFYKI